MSKEKPHLQDHEFNLLLTWLGGDADDGALAYLDVQKRMTALFINWQCCNPEELADESLNRVGRQLAEGKEIKTGNRVAYVHGIAKHIRSEHWRRCKTCLRHRATQEGNDLELPDTATVLSESGEHDDKERRLECLDSCLEGLSADERSCLLSYYSENKTLKIVTRDQMAQRLGVTSGALRQRIWKLRTSVRDCVVNCTAE